MILFLAQNQYSRTIPKRYENTMKMERNSAKSAGNHWKHLYIHMVFGMRFPTCKNINNPIGILMVLQFGKRILETLVFHCSNQHFPMTSTANHSIWSGNSWCFRMRFPVYENSNNPIGLLMILQIENAFQKHCVFLAQINTFPWLWRKTASITLEIHAVFECVFRFTKTAIYLMDYWWFCNSENAFQKHCVSIAQINTFPWLWRETTSIPFNFIGNWKANEQWSACVSRFTKTVIFLME